MALYFVRRMGPWVAIVFVYAFVAAGVLQWSMLRAGEPAPDFGESLYAIFTQLFFQPSEPLPHAAIARALFWLSPVVGAVLIAEGLFKIGAELFNAEARQRLWVRVVSERLTGHVVVCGLGHVGYRVVEELRRLQQGIVAIEISSASMFVETVKGMGIPVFVADVRRDEVLVSAGIERAQAVICATDDDLVNLEVAIDAKRMNPAIRVVMRMFDQRLASKVGGALDVDRTFSTSALSAPLVALQATHKGIRAAYRLDDGTTRVTAELVIGEAFERATVDAVEGRVGARVISVRKKAKGAFVGARSSTELKPGDAVVVDTRVDALGEIAEALSATFEDAPAEPG